MTDLNASITIHAFPEAFHGNSDFDISEISTEELGFAATERAIRYHNRARFIHLLVIAFLMVLLAIEIVISALGPLDWALPMPAVQGIALFVSFFTFRLEWSTRLR